MPLARRATDLCFGHDLYDLLVLKRQDVQITNTLASARACVRVCVCVCVRVCVVVVVCVRVQCVYVWVGWVEWGVGEGMRWEEEDMATHTSAADRMRVRVCCLQKLLSSLLGGRGAHRPHPPPPCRHACAGAASPTAPVQDAVAKVHTYNDDVPNPDAGFPCRARPANLGHDAAVVQDPSMLQRHADAALLLAPGAGRQFGTVMSTLLAGEETDSCRQQGVYATRAAGAAG